MGAAVGKAAEELTVAVERLDAAEHVILQWNRTPGANTGIWDAQAAYTNRDLLAAVDELLHLAEAQPFPMSSAARRRLDGAVNVAMSRMVEEFLRLRVWNASQSQLRAAVEKLSVSLPTTTANTTSTDGELSASGGSQASVPDEVAALLDGEFLDELDLLCPASVSVLHEIAHRVIRAGYTKEFVRAFAQAPCDALDRFLSIIQTECSQRTTEVVIKRWTLATKLVGKALVIMQRQLHAQSPGAFDGFRDEYLLAITKNRILRLLDFADEFTSLMSHEKLVYILGMYEALSNAAPSLLLLFSGANKRLISQRSEDILAKLAGSIKTMADGLVAKIRGDCSPNTQSAAAGSGVGVHPLARYTMARIESLAPHRDTLDLILASGGAARSLGDLASQLTSCLERGLEEKSALCGAAGSRHLFLANNASFVLKRAEGSKAMSLLGNRWAERWQRQIDEHLASYVEASWAPAVACLEAAGRKRVANFNSAFEDAYSIQVRCEVPDPAFRAALRKAVLEMVVPVYRAYLGKHPKLGRSVRYTADKLTEMLLELFEGEGGERRKS